MTEYSVPSISALPQSESALPLEQSAPLKQNIINQY